MAFKPPRARALIILDSGAVPYTAALAAYDGTVGSTPTPTPVPTPTPTPVPTPTPTPVPTPTPTPTSTGYDIVLARTDSLGNGVYDGDPARDTDIANVFQWRSRDPAGISADITPLDSGTAQANQPTMNPYSPINSMAKAYEARTGRKLLVMLHGYNGSGYNSAIWSPGGQYHEEFVGRANAAIAAAKAIDPTSSLVAIVEILATNDAGMTKAAFKAAKLGAMADVRARVTGAASTPYLHVSQMPENIAGDTDHRRPIMEAIQEIVAVTPNTRYVPIREGFNFAGDTTDRGDFTHTSNPGGRRLGADLDAALADVTAPVITTAAAISVPDGSKLAAAMRSDGYASVEILPVDDYASFEVARIYGTGGASNINAVHWDDVVRFAGDAVASYATKSSYSFTVRMRDWARNATDKQFTVTVAQPYGVGDQGPVTVAAVYGATDTPGGYGYSVPDVPTRKGLILSWSRYDGADQDLASIKLDGFAGTREFNGANSELWSGVRGTDEAAELAVNSTSYMGSGSIGMLVLNGTKRSPAAVQDVPWNYVNGGGASTAAITCPANGVIVGIAVAAFAATFNAGTTVIGQSGNVYFLKRTATGPIAFTNGGGYGGIIAAAYEKSL